MINLNSAFTVKGLSLGDIVGIFGGEEDPRTVDSSLAPVGCLYLQSNGATWSRYGLEPTAWARMVITEGQFGVNILDPITSTGAKVNEEGALFVYQAVAPAPVVGTANRVRILNGLLGTGGLDAGITNFLG